MIQNLFFVICILLVAKCDTPEQDRTYRLHDIWALESLYGDRFKSLEGAKHPVIEIYVKEQRTLGSAHCNEFSSSISKLTKTQIRFADMISTEMACSAIDEEQSFFMALEEVRTYDLADLKLHFYDLDGENVLSFRKVD